MRQSLTTLSIVICITLFFGCGKPQSFEYRQIKNFKISNWGFDRSTVAMDLVYFNPNNFGLKLRNVECDIYLDKTFVGKFMLDTLMTIDKRSEFALPASIQVDMRNIFKNSLNVIFSKEVTVGAKGTTRVGKGGVFVTIPFNYEGKHEVSFF